MTRGDGKVVEMGWKRGVKDGWYRVVVERRRLKTYIPVLWSSSAWLAILGMLLLPGLTLSLS